MRVRDLADFMLDENDKPSMTRLVLLAAMALLCYLSIGQVEVDTQVFHILNTTMLTCLGGLGVRGCTKHMTQKETE